MPAYNGALMLLKLQLDDGQYTTIGGLRSTRFLLNNQTIDVTNKLSGKWRELLGASGISSVSITGSGVFTDNNAEKLVKKAAFANEIKNYQIQFGNGEKLTGAFQITSYERLGGFDDEETYSITLESSGEVNF